VLRALANGHDDVLTAVVCLADYLDGCGSPIDYQRGRALIPTETITPGQWRELWPPRRRPSRRGLPPP